jgi:glycosyltransferase involved in cell wall biosynthesis
MRVLIALTYYRPHFSGLTIYAERLARSLAARGHSVQVLTSRFSPDLPEREVRDGVEVIRLPVALRVSKGVIMPGMPGRAWKLIRAADVVNLHLPQFDAAIIGGLARLRGKPVVLTYQCDLRLPQGAVHAIANQVSHVANHLSGLAANLIVSTSRDYAENSFYLSHFMDKVRVVTPAVEVVEPSPDEEASFRLKANPRPGQRVIGMAARLATEKGVEHLVAAMPRILERYPEARVLFMGQYQNVLGEELYAARLAPMIERLGEHWTFLGNLSPGELTAFYRLCEVTVLPSLNSTEAFGLVQVESMVCGTPVVASDLPGVRQPVRMTGMGLIVPPADPEALAEAIIRVLDNRQAYLSDPQAVAERFSLDHLAEAYEKLFAELLGGQEVEPARLRVRPRVEKGE